MAEWCKTTLGEICDKLGGIIQTGPFGSQLHESDYSNDGTPVVMPKDIIEGRIALTGIARVSSKHVQRLSRHQLKRGDIVYGRRGDIGRQALIRQNEEGWLCGTGCLRISLRHSIVDPVFLHYYLRQDLVIGWIANQAIGATLPNLNTSILRSVPIRLPPLPVQRRIAGILSVYDDLIENNQRRIKILEEMARSLYREWFVNFRFPGHEKVSLVDSPLGPIPKGWEVKTLRDVCSKLIDGTHDSPKPSQSGYPLVTGRHIKNGFIDFSDTYSISEDEHQKVMKRSRPEKGDIIYSNIGTLGEATLVDQDFEYSIKNVALFKPLNASYSPFLYCYLADPDTLRLLQSKASGTSQKFFSLEFLRATEIVVPSEDKVCLFAGKVLPIIEYRSSLNKRNESLRCTRDLLLPRLLSGQITIPKVDENLERAAYE